jgi:dipeptidyl aminopeptidase/acylaminoacyl peptidase
MQRRPLVPEDIRRQVVVEEHDLSRAGDVAVVGRRFVRRNRYVRHLWAVPLNDGVRGRPRRLASGLVTDGWPRLSPDGRRVAFIRQYPSGRDPESVIGLVPVDGGRVRELRSGDHGAIGSVEWSPDGRRLAYTADVDPPRFLVGDVPLVGRPRRAKPGDDDAPTARRITRIDWRLDGYGHLDRWSHLFVIDARSGSRPRQVTAGDWEVGHIVWSPDGRTVAFDADRGASPDLDPRTTIWTVDVDATSSRPREVLAPAGWAQRPAYSPDGRWLAAIGSIEAATTDEASREILIGPSDGSTPSHAIAPDLDRPIGNWTDTDLHGWLVYGRPGPVWLGNDRIVATVTDRGRSRPWVFDLPDGPSGRADARPIVDGDLTTHSLAVSPGGLVSWLGTVGGRAMDLMTAGLPPRGDPARPTPRARTTMGSAWQRRHPLPLMTAVEAPGAGGPIETWIASPPDAPDGPLPTVVDIHGGPLGSWPPAPHLEVSLLVARGYRVVLPNIRGSASYGREWIRPQLGDWGGVDAADVHATLDHVIALGLADSDRLGVLGLSYGGFMVHWLVGTSDRFRAAVSENGVTNQVSTWANSDIGPDYDRNASLGDVLTPEGVAKLWRQSPLRHVAAIRTPLLLLQGEADLRCVPQDNEQLFVALRSLGRTVEYVLYPEESHEFSSSGRPDRRIDRQHRMLDWFDRFLRA